MVGYYARVAPVLVPHLAGRAITLKRFPNGVDGTSFFEKNCPSYKPPWLETVKMGDVNYCLVEDAASVVWLANLAAIELHPTLATKPDLGSPTSVVFDLDPGPPADVITCARVASLVRDLLAQLHLETWAKTSGSKGIQLYAPAQQRGDLRALGPFRQGGRPIAGAEAPRTDRVLPTEDSTGGQGPHRLEPERVVEDNRFGILAAGQAPAHRLDAGHLGRGGRCIVGRRPGGPDLRMGRSARTS